MTDPRPPRLRAVTREVYPIEDLLAYADPAAPLAWLRRGDGIVAVGSPVAAAVRVGAGAAARTALVAQQWQQLVADAEVDDPVGLPGTGLVAFGALVFDDRSGADSVLTVPQALVGRHRGRSWLTRIESVGSSAASSAGPDAAPVAREYGPHWAGTLGPGSLTPDGYQAAVRAALEAIGAGEVSKVVVARDLAGSVPADADLRRLVRTLAGGYPDTWAFAVDGLIGASPETLATVTGGTMTARVLAGTAPRGADADADTAASLLLATSPKDQDEHQYAVRSVLGALGPHTSAVAASEQPFTLRLPNVWHLATDIEGTLHGAATALDLVGALHPTAAVAGTPTPAALEVIRRLEPFDRGRYAGPVGWVDARGDGEWAIALRCAQVDPGGALTAYAGAGIVAGSDPEAELLETRVKFRPVVDALA